MSNKHTGNPVYRQLPTTPHSVIKKTNLSQEMHQKIWMLIQNRNYEGLIKLFGISTTTPRSCTPSPKPNGFFKVLPKTLNSTKHECRDASQALAEQMVRAFFEKTETKALKDLIGNRDYKFFGVLLRACSQHTRYQLAIEKVLHPICLHIKLEYLDVMSDSFISLGIHRDHKALLSILDALLIRQLSLDNHKDINDCKRLRRQLFESGIEFHTKKNHIHVSRFLNQLLMNSEVEQQEYCSTIEIDDEQISDLETAQPLSEHPIYQAVQREAHLFHDTHLEDSVGQPNLAHFYTSEDVNHILELRLPEELRSAAMGAIRYHHSEFDMLLRDSVSHRIDSQFLLYPILVDNHWVGISIQPDPCPLRGRVVTFYDSITSTDRAKDLEARIMPILTSIYGHQIHWTVMPNPSLQPDGTSCGAYLIENMVSHVVGQKAHERSNLDIRREHLNLLREWDFGYYEGHAQPTHSGDKRSRTHENDQSIVKKFR